jgi:hypothetical protein
LEFIKKLGNMTILHNNMVLKQHNNSLIKPYFL